MVVVAVMIVTDGGGGDDNSDTDGGGCDNNRVNCTKFKRVPSVTVFSLSYDSLGC